MSRCEICGTELTHGWASSEYGVPVVACSRCAKEWHEAAHDELASVLAALKDTHRDEREDTDPHTAICELAAKLKAAEDERDALRAQVQAAGMSHDYGVLVVQERDRLQRELAAYRKSAESDQAERQRLIAEREQVLVTNATLRTELAALKKEFREIDGAREVIAAERDEAIARREETVALLEQVKASADGMADAIDRSLNNNQPAEYEGVWGWSRLYAQKTLDAYRKATQ